MQPDEAREMAADLLRQLSACAGDRSAIDAVLRDLVDDVGARATGLVCAAAVQMTVADCLTPAAVADVPADAVEFRAPERTPA